MRPNRGGHQREPGQQRVNVVPVRFATACVSGHLDEFPWNQWVGHNPDCHNRDRLTLASEAPGLAKRLLDDVAKEKCLIALRSLRSPRRGQGRREKSSS